MQTCYHYNTKASGIDSGKGCRDKANTVLGREQVSFNDSILHREVFLLYHCLLSTIER